MGELWFFRGTTILAGMAALFALACLLLVLTNRSLERQTDEQRQFLQQTAQLNGVNEALVRLMARAALDEKDQQLRDILVSHGFRFDPGASPASAGQAPVATPAPAPAGEAKK